MKAYKFLAEGAIGPFSRFRWPTPERGAPGAWVRVRAPLETCRSGIHACRVGDLPWWLHRELWLVELEAPIVDHEVHVVLAPAARLLARVEAWPAAERELGEACAWRARDMAAAALGGAGRPAEAAALAACTTLDGLETASAAAAAATEGTSLADLAGYCGDTAYLAREGKVATAAYVVAHMGVEAAERAWQAAWLARRLGLA